MLCTALSEIIIRAEIEKRNAILCGLLVSIFFMFFGRLIFDRIKFPLGYANPLNFFPYVFSSFYIVNLQKINKINNHTLYYWLLIFMIFACAELSHVFTKFSTSDYGRISLLIASMHIMILFQKITPPKWIKYISSLSLGLYVIHDIVIIYIRNISNSFNISANDFVVFFSTVIVSIIFARILKYKNENII
jgi:surface polysaccharide O-acyltransferase-like enzyme